MNEQTEIPNYPHPEPKLYDVWFYSLLIPAVFYVIGVIVYGAEALRAQALTWTRQGVGSALMVIGGEIGTLFTVMEVYRKQKIKDNQLWDWLGMIVSLASTLGILFVVFARQTTLAAPWIIPVRNWGPLALLLCSGLDFYANIIELGYYRASFDTRMEKFHTDRYKHELRWRRILRELRETERKESELAPTAPTSPQRRANPDEKSAIVAGLDGENANLDAKAWNALLVSRGFLEDEPGTARYWAKKARETEQ